MRRASCRSWSLRATREPVACGLRGTWGLVGELQLHATGGVGRRVLAIAASLMFNGFIGYKCFPHFLFFLLYSFSSLFSFANSFLY